MKTKEIWRVVPSLPFLQASSYGRLRVIPHHRKMPNGGTRTYGGEPTLGQWDGERFIHRIRGKTHKVARLVCEAFKGPPPPDKPYCLHHDENSANNKPGNLRWGTQKQNLNYPGFIAYCQSRTGEKNPYVRGRHGKA